MYWLVGDNLNMIVTYGSGGLLNKYCGLGRIEGNNRNQDVPLIKKGQKLSPFHLDKPIFCHFTFM